MSILRKIQKLFQSDKLDVSRRFELLREAITGTMSQFFLARDHESGKIVGLKLLDKDKTAAFEARFKTLKKPSEGEIAISLKHPLIVETYEHGVTDAGQPYLVMEFVKGTNLHTMLANRDSVLQGHRLHIVRQMAESLEAVHAAGYIHRDVCPRNFIYDHTTEILKMIDFGLTLPATKDFMQPGNRTGTPLYMAPEVVRRRPTDLRLDIFAFGVSAYQILTFEFPWPVTDTTGLGALSHDTQPPTDILRYRPNLNPVLAQAVMRCIARRPEDRFESISAFLRAIRKVETEEVAEGQSGKGAE